MRLASIFSAAFRKSLAIFKSSVPYNFFLDRIAKLHQPRPPPNAKMHTPTSIGEYTILPIFIPQSSTYQVQPTHHIYLRPHTPKITTASDSRSLFLVNVPIDSTAAHFRALFTSIVGVGKFESITFQNENSHASVPGAEFVSAKPNGKKRKRGNSISAAKADDGLPKIWDRELRRSGSTAVLVMADEKSVEVTLKSIHKISKKGKLPIWGEGVDSSAIQALGSSRYKAHQTIRYPSQSALESNVNNFMTNFNSREALNAETARKKLSEPDEDGFVTVVATRGGRNNPVRQAEAEEARKKMEDKKVMLTDFYRFQGRERRKAEQGELVKQFEADKEKLEAMKKRRGTSRPE